MDFESKQIELRPLWLPLAVSPDELRLFRF